VRISILTPDSPRPNLAAMKISAWHKAQGHSVELNFPLMGADFTYASMMFRQTPDPIADLIGGPKYPDSMLDPEIEAMRPDYDLYPDIDYSLGYTYRACPRSCDFCIVPHQKNPETHHSIWSFHDARFKKIDLLNNNTLADPQWRETFEEIIEAKLIMAEHGLDVRLVTEETASYLKRIKIDGYLHIAWDYPDHEEEILKGLDPLLKAKVRNLMCYVLIGHTSHEEDLHRCLKLDAMGVDPYVMALDKTDPYQYHFARWVNHKAIFKTVEWKDYKRYQTTSADVEP
jgi:hypothetical protein